MNAFKARLNRFIDKMYEQRIRIISMQITVQFGISLSQSQGSVRSNQVSSPRNVKLQLTNDYLNVLMMKTKGVIENSILTFNSCTNDNCYINTCITREAFAKFSGCRSILDVEFSVNKMKQLLESLIPKMNIVVMEIKSSSINSSYRPIKSIEIQKLYHGIDPGDKAIPVDAEVQVTYNEVVEPTIQLTRSFHNKNHQIFFYKWLIVVTNVDDINYALDVHRYAFGIVGSMGCFGGGINLRELYEFTKQKKEEIVPKVVIADY